MRLAVGKQTVKMPSSKTKVAIANVLKSKATSPTRACSRERRQAELEFASSITKASR
jgi:ribosomal protein S8